MTYIRPVLVQYATSGSATTPLPDGCYIDPTDAMLRAPGASTPLVESLLAKTAEGIDAMTTTLTEASEDSVDPDTIRATQEQLVTFITRAEEEPNDPDVIRLDGQGGFDTMLTKSDVDPGDPDTVRLNG